MSKVEHLPCGPYANMSEKEASERLLAKLRAHSSVQRWVLMTNVAYSMDVRGTPHEIDIVAVGTTGLFVVEVKHWDRAYLKTNPSVVQREAEKLHAKAQRIATSVRRWMPELGYVSGALLLTREKDSLGSANRPVIAGAKAYTLADWKQLLQVDGPSVLPDAERIERPCSVPPRPASESISRRRKDS